MQFTIKQGMNQDILKSYPDNHFDSIVTDPPYGIEFLGKDWDSNTGALETWEECFRVLKPGGHILAFSAARTYHNLATNIESVGFEIRDQLMWIYASGFPKAQDIGKAIEKRKTKQTNFSLDSKEYKLLQHIKGDLYKHPDGKHYRKMPLTKGDSWKKSYGNKAMPTTYEQVFEHNNKWSGWKTALKPAHEPIVMARKPFKGSAIDNVLKHGTGALNIDATRVEWDGKVPSGVNGKDPRNRLLELPGETVETRPGETDVWKGNEQGRFPSNVFGEIPDYQKYFYCPKVSRAERHCGFESVPQPEPFNNPDEMKKHPLWDPSIGTNSHRLMQKIRAHNKGSLDHIATDPAGMFDHGISYMAHKDANSIISTEHMIEAMGGKLITNNRVWTPDLGEFYIHGLKEEYIKWCEKNNKATGSMGNNHPTVKPVALMSYLVKLVTPEGGKVLDPFNGSGSTGMACVEHGFDYTGCELDPAYVEIATKRIQGWYNKTQPDNNFNELFDGDKP